MKTERVELRSFSRVQLGDEIEVKPGKFLAGRVLRVIGKGGGLLCKDELNNDTPPRWRNEGDLSLAAQAYRGAR
jgi:hypothetical protein